MPWLKSPPRSIGMRSRLLTFRRQPNASSVCRRQPATMLSPSQTIFPGAVRTAALRRGNDRRLRMEQMQDSGSHLSSQRVVDEIDRARAREYALLATLLSRSPDAGMIERLALLGGDESPLGAAHADLGAAAGRADEASAGREYFDLFGGLGQSPLLPYASHYLTGSLHGRPPGRAGET